MKKVEKKSTESQYYFGLDLGQTQDYTAMVAIDHITHEWIVEDEKTADRDIDFEYEYYLRYMKRYELRTSYTDIVRNVKKILYCGRFGEEPILVVDATGVGQAVMDVFHDADLDPIAIKIHGGEKVNQEGMEIHVPKRDLVGALMVHFQNDELKIARTLAESHTLSEELQNFRVKINTRGHDSYEAWREGDHDDLVLATAIACWMIREDEQAPKARWA